MSTNESLLEELTRAVEQKKRLEVERAEVLEANEELFNESERLTNEETRWDNERTELLTKIEQLTELSESLKNQLNSKPQNDDAHAELESLRKDKSQLVELVTQMEVENTEAAREIERMNESNMNKMKSHLEAAMSKCKALEREKKQLKAAAAAAAAPDKEKASQVSELVEKNKALTEWRRQLVEKNQSLVRLGEIYWTIRN